MDRLKQAITSAKTDIKEDLITLGKKNILARKAYEEAIAPAKKAYYEAKASAKPDTSQG